jgi:hypothetical protein
VLLAHGFVVVASWWTRLLFVELVAVFVTGLSLDHFQTIVMHCVACVVILVTREVCERHPKALAIVLSFTRKLPQSLAVYTQHGFIITRQMLLAFAIVPVFAILLKERVLTAVVPVQVKTFQSITLCSPTLSI